MSNVENYEMVLEFVDQRWESEKEIHIINSIIESFYEWQEKYQEKPNVVGLTLGFELYNRLVERMNDDYKLDLLGFLIPCEESWEVPPRYIKLVLSRD